MKQIIKFLSRNRYFLLFLLLEIIAILFTIQHNSYHKSKFINSANAITSSVYKVANKVNSFFYLKVENKRLLEENTRLKNLLSIKNIDNTLVLDSTKYYQRYKYTIAKIIKNDYSKRNNYLLINKGRKNGIASEMGVVNSKGIIGVTNNVSSHAATVISILNKNLKINAKFMHDNHFGTLSWDGADYKTIQLLDLPRQTQFKVGDTLITGGKSTIFPEGILIGIVKDFKKNHNIYEYINIDLFNDMSSISNVNIITNLYKKEILQLETAIDE